MTGEQQESFRTQDAPVGDVAKLTAADLDGICLSNLLSSSTDTVYFKDLESRFIRVSESQARHTGATSPADMLGKTDFDYFTPEHATAAFAAEQEIIRTGVPQSDVHEYDALPGDSGRVVSSTKQPLRDSDGRIIGTFGISRDVSARRRMQAQLLAKTAELDLLSRELKTILDISPDPIARFDPELRYVYANPAAEALYGATAADLVGHTDRELKHPEEFVAEWADALRKVLASGLAYELEHTVEVAGTRRHLHTRLLPELDEGGRVRSVLAVSHDLTDR